MLLTKVFMKVLADGRNSAIVLSFSSSFGRPNTMRQSIKNYAMEQELSNCPSADGTFFSSTFPNTHSLFATNAKTEDVQNR